MVHYDKRKQVTFETTTGYKVLDMKKWNEGEENEHWSFAQYLKEYFTFEDKDTTTFDIISELADQYAVTHKLIQRGWEYHSCVEDGVILWVKYTDQNS